MTSSLDRSIHDFSLRWVVWEQDVRDAVAKINVSPETLCRILRNSRVVDHGDWRDAITQAATSTAPVVAQEGIVRGSVVSHRRFPHWRGVVRFVSKTHRVRCKTDIEYQASWKEIVTWREADLEVK